MTADVRYLLPLSKAFLPTVRSLDPLARPRDHLDGLHANTQNPKIIGFNRLYQLTGQKNYLTASSFNASEKTVANTRSCANGNHGDGEHFFSATLHEHVFEDRQHAFLC